MSGDLKQFFYFTRGFLKGREVIKMLGKREISVEQYKAYEKSLNRWGRIKEVTGDLYYRGVNGTGSPELKIPPCAMCELIPHPSLGDRECGHCVWVEKCNDYGSSWKKVRECAEALRIATAKYLKKAEDHFATLTSPPPEPPKPKGLGELQIGDVVKAGESFGDNRSLAGETGQVVALEPGQILKIGVQFQTGFLGGHSCNDKGLRGHGWFGRPEELELVYRGTKDC